MEFDRLKWISEVSIPIKANFLKKINNMRTLSMFNLMKLLQLIKQVLKKDILIHSHFLPLTIAINMKNWILQEL